MVRRRTEATISGRDVHTPTRAPQILWHSHSGVKVESKKYEQTFNVFGSDHRPVGPSHLHASTALGGPWGAPLFLEHGCMHVHTHTHTLRSGRCTN